MNGMGSVQISDSRRSGPEAAGSMNDRACGESQIPGWVWDMETFTT